ncbi:MAG: SDR family NAD(P)-dependent oxidoreductase [Acidimicrobiales bacterium]
MAGALVWISGASSGIGAALVRAVPWPQARVIGISRRPPAGAAHLAADLSDPDGWRVVGQSFTHELAGFAGDVVAFVHAAGSIEPVGFASAVDAGAYQANVVLNSAAPQVLGQMFLAATEGVEARRHLVMITSGAARSVYPGWTAYGAAKAATDQWVRTAGAEQPTRGGAHVLAVAPGTVDTAMQARLREASEADFPQRQKFVDLHAGGRLSDPDEVARRIWALLDGGTATGDVVDLRQVAGQG